MSYWNPKTGHTPYSRYQPVSDQGSTPFLYWQFGLLKFFPVSKGRTISLRGQNKREVRQLDEYQTLHLSNTLRRKQHTSDNETWLQGTSWQKSAPFLEGISREQWLQIIKACIAALQMSALDFGWSTGMIPFGFQNKCKNYVKCSMWKRECMKMEA